MSTRAYLAVDFFFCLSGFVIAFAYQDRLSGSMSFRSFLVTRLIRLYPTFLVGTLMGCVVYLLGAHTQPSESLIVCLTSLALLPGGLLFGREAFPTNNPSWSLFFELFANALYALMKTLTLTVFAVFLLASALALIAISVACGGLNDIGFHGPLSFVLGFVRVAFPFAAGVFIHRTGLAGKISLPAYIPISILMIVMLSPTDTGGYIDPLISICVFPCVVALGVGATLTSGTHFLAVLGKLSYPFYIIHQPIIRVLKNIHALNPLSQISPVALPIVSLCVALAASYVVVVWFDEPVRRTLGAWYKARRAARPERAGPRDDTYAPAGVAASPSLRTAGVNRPSSL